MILLVGYNSFVQANKIKATKCTECGGENTNYAPILGYRHFVYCDDCKCNTRELTKEEYDNINKNFDFKAQEEQIKIHRGHYA